jgi:hypothetical protein
VAKHAKKRLAFSIRADSVQQLELVQPSPPPQLEFGLEKGRYSLTRNPGKTPLQIVKQ